MLKEKFKEFCDIVNNEIEKGNFAIEVESKEFNNDYIDGIFTMDDVKTGCGINRKGYICWYYVDWLKNVIYKENEMKIVNRALEEFFKDEETKLETEIAEKQKELDEIRKIRAA